MPASKGPLSVVNPALAAQWSPRNTLTPDDVSVSSRTKVLWVCCKGHEWEAKVCDRHGGTGCPFCTNRRVLAGFNDLATVAAHLVAEWHPTKNTVTPSDVLAASTKKVWWRCGHGHEWEARIDLRVKKGFGCGVCNGKRTLTGLNDLVTRFPEIAAEWHPTKNGGVSPSSVSGSSGTKYWWLGACGHEWEANVRNRTYNKSGCPVCAGTMIISGINDLATLYPRVAAQWHPSRNHLNADQVSPGSEKDA